MHVRLCGSEEALGGVLGRAREIDVQMRMAAGCDSGGGGQAVRTSRCNRDATACTAFRVDPCGLYIRGVQKGGRRRRGLGTPALQFRFEHNARRVARWALFSPKMDTWSMP